MEIRRLEEQGMTRNVLVQRNTKETKITMSLNLDGTGKASLNTGIGFFDHMLDGFARHGFFDLDPVSYTHLDVYKRQLLWSAAFRRAVPW